MLADALNNSETELGRFSSRRNGAYSADDSEPATAVERSVLETWKTNAVYAVLLCGAAASALAMAVFADSVTIAMGAVCVLTIPAAVVGETKLAKLPSIRNLNNETREEANELMDQSEMLSEEIDALESEVGRLARSEDELQALVEKQGMSADALVGLMKENEAIQKKMRDNLRQVTVSTIVSLVLQSDRDNTQTINEKEARVLALKIDIALMERGVRFDQEKFLKAIGGGNCSVHAIINRIVSKLLRSEEDDDEETVGGAAADDDSDDDEEDEDDVCNMFRTADNGGKTQAVAGCDGGVSLVVRRTVRRSRDLIRKAKRKCADRGTPKNRRFAEFWSRFDGGDGLPLSSSYIEMGRMEQKANLQVEEGAACCGYTRDYGFVA